MYLSWFETRAKSALLTMREYIVGWAKARSDVPTILGRISRLNGGHVTGRVRVR
jgi:hypothetical protein